MFFITVYISALIYSNVTLNEREISRIEGELYFQKTILKLIMKSLLKRLAATAAIIMLPKDSH